MWALTTSHGMRVDNIEREQDARGRQFVAEVRRAR
jgi:hypothetical protein